MGRKKGRKMSVGELVEAPIEGVLELRSERAEFLARRIDRMDPLTEISRSFKDLDELRDEIELLGEEELALPGVKHRHKMTLEITKTRLTFNEKLLSRLAPNLASVTIADSDDSEAKMLKSVPKVTLRVIHSDKKQ